jgi:hypothetical protein
MGSTAPVATTRRQFQAGGRHVPSSTASIW